MENIYKNDLLDYASKLDAITKSKGTITENAILIVNNQEEKATLSLLKQISEQINGTKYSKEVKQISKALNDTLIKYLGYNRILKFGMEKQEDKDERNLEQLLEDLSQLVGLEKVKSKVYDLISYQKVQKLRKQHGLKTSKNTMHLAFVGNPGTGKTTVARIIGRIYKQIGILSKGHFVEVSRTDLIAGYQGQTALKVKKIIEEAKGGVLFIDEAYSITENDHSDSYGRECLTELTKALEDYREDLVVIVAGYTDPMNKFFESNPGLKSRFNSFITFDDYSANELEKIMQGMCKENDYSLSESVKDGINKYFLEEINNKEENFSNGRLARNLYDDIVMNHAKRVGRIENPTRQELSKIELEDLL